MAGHTNTMIEGLRHRLKLITALKLAEEVRQNLLPQEAPSLQTLDIAGTSVYCDETGGDYYYYFELANETMALGVRKDYQFQESTGEGWTPGSVIIVGTNGIREARNEEHEMFGLNRLQEVIRKHAAKSAEEIQQGVTDALRTFRGDAPQEDDITLVVVKYV